MLAARGQAPYALSCMARDNARPMSKRPWPKGKPLPHFASYEEELAFWERYDLPDDETGWEAVPGPAVLDASAVEGYATFHGEPPKRRPPRR